MSTDKTLADVQPGGSVRLATVPYDRARDLLGDAYNAGTHGIGYSQQTMELHDAIIPAQPSLGGQDAARYERLFISAVEMLTKISLHLGLEPNSDGVEPMLAAIDALAARQPVEFERAIPTRRRESAVELLLQLGFVWNNQRWEDRRQPVGVPAAWMHTHKATGRVEFGLSPMYDCDFNAVQWDSVALYAAPAQAVDLGQFRPAVELMEWQERGHANPDFPRGDAKKHAEALRLLALIDSQDRPNG